MKILLVEDDPDLGKLLSEYLKMHEFEVLHAIDGKTTLEEVFAEIEITRLREDLKNAQQNPEKIPAKIKNLINEPQYPEKLANLVKKSELKPKSNRILR